MSRRPTSNAAEELRLIPLLRFQEKGRMSSSSSSSYDSDEDVELGASMEQEIELTDFKQAAEAVRGELEGLHSLLARLKKALEDLYTSSGGEETKELQKEASQLRTELDEATKGVRSELQRLHQENNALRRSSHNSSSTLFRIRVNVHGSLLQQFKEWTRQYREVLGEAETRNKKLMLQQIQIGIYLYLLLSSLFFFFLLLPSSSIFLFFFILVLLLLLLVLVLLPSSFFLLSFLWTFCVSHKEKVEEAIEVLKKAKASHKTFSLVRQHQPSRLLTCKCTNRMLYTTSGLMVCNPMQTKSK
ncbi:Plasma membrane t-SNARE, secretory vesicle fusion, variant 2 [Balamuthia mandrillaris]